MESFDYVSDFPFGLKISQYLYLVASTDIYQSMQRKIEEQHAITRWLRI